MSKIGSYPTRTFKESQKFLVLDPETQSASLVPGRDLVDYITPSKNYVYAESTRAAAQATDYPVGALIETAGSETAGDNFAAVYLVVAGGQGDVPMQNGNDLLVIRGDEFLRQETGGGIRRVDSLAGLQAISGRFAGDVAYMVGRTTAGDGGAGEFVWHPEDMSAEVASDPLEGVYVAPSADPSGATGAWVRSGSSFPVTAWGADPTGAADSSSAFSSALAYNGECRIPEGEFLLQGPITTSASPTDVGLIIGAGESLTTLRFDHAGDGITIVSPPANTEPSEVSGFSVKTGPTEPENIIVVDTGGENTVIERLDFYSMSCSGSGIYNKDAYGLTLREVNCREVSVETGFIRLGMTQDETRHSYAVTMYSCDVSAVSSAAGQYTGTGINMEGGMLSIFGGVIQACGTGIAIGDGVNFYPRCSVDGVHFEANREYNVKCTGTGGNRAILDLKSCLISNTYSAKISLSGAKAKISSSHVTTGDIGIESASSATLLLESNQRITAQYLSFADFQGTLADVNLDILPGLSNDQPFEIYGVNLNKWGGSLVEFYTNNGTGDSTMYQLWAIRHGNGTGGFFSAELVSKMAGPGNANDFVFTSDPDGTLYASISGTANVQFRVRSL